MATLKQGVLGGFSGKAGTVVGYTRKGVAYIRGLMTSITTSYAPALVEQRAKFALVMKFLRPWWPCFVSASRMRHLPARAIMPLCPTPWKCP